MVTVPAFVWRGGFLFRALTIGGSVGIGVAVLAWLDSGFLLTGVLVFVIIAVFYGSWMPRRMARLWPGAARLTGDERVAIARAARSGESIDDPRLAPQVIEYRDGLRVAAETARPLKWLLIFVLVVAVVTAVWDALYGSWGNAVVSAIYLVLLLLEVFWWPKRQRQLLVNADNAARLAAGHGAG